MISRAWISMSVDWPSKPDDGWWISWREFGSAIREPGIDRAARRVDVDRDVLVRVLRLQVQELRDDEVGDLVVDRRAEEDDPLVEQPRVDVELALATRRALDDHGDQGHGR